MSAPPAKKTKSDLDVKAEMEEKDLLEIRTHQDKLDELNENARLIFWFKIWVENVFSFRTIILNKYFYTGGWI